MATSFPVNIYSPNGELTTCEEIVRSKGGWDRLSAQEASALVQLGCSPETIDVGDQNYIANVPIVDTGGYQVGEVGYRGPEISTPVANAPISDPSEVFLEERPLWSGPVEEPMYETDFPIGFTGGEMNMSAAYFGQAGQIIGEIGKAIGGALVQEGVSELVGQIPQFGVNVTPGAACWDRARATGKVNRRMRVKLQRMPDGSVQVVRYCAPRRMNPCNARALGRAARRLAMFQRMSAGIDKMLARVIKRKSSSRPYFGGRRSCAPKRCR